MAAANESQGLKIAVAAFIALSVILTVSSYFLYSNYSSAEARLQSATRRSLDKSQGREPGAQPISTTCEAKIGVKAAEHEPAKEEINAHLKKLDERLDELLKQVNAAIAEGPARGSTGPRAGRGQAKHPEDRRVDSTASPTRPISRRSTACPS